MIRKLLRAAVHAAGALVVSMNAIGAGEPGIPPERAAMLDAIRASVRHAADYTGRTKLDPRTLAAMAAVPRERFVPQAYRHLAYVNQALPIAAGQTISQPLIVALMTDLLALQDSDRVLEIGTGSGYQAAVLAQLAAQVYSVEIVPELARAAGDTLRALALDNIHIRSGDGYAGWLEHAPYDAIMVTAAPEQIPPPLLQQLKPGGRLVLPVGEQRGFQQLLLVTVGQDGEVHEQAVLPVSFVPFTRDR